MSKYTFATLPRNHWRVQCAERVGCNLRDAREGRGWTVHEMAVRLGINAVTYLHYEIGKKAIPVDMLIGAAALTQMSPTFFLPSLEAHEVST